MCLMKIIALAGKQLPVKEYSVMNGIYMIHTGPLIHIPNPIMSNNKSSLGHPNTFHDPYYTKYSSY